MIRRLQGLLQCGVLRMLRPDCVQPRAEVRGHRGVECGDEVRRLATRFPSTIGTRGLRAAKRDVTAERQQCRGDSHIGFGKPLRPLGRAAFVGRVLTRLQRAEADDVLFAVVAWDQPVIPGAAHNLQRGLGEHRFLVYGPGG